MSTNDIEVGDTVRIGKGKTLWTVTNFGVFTQGQAYAALQSVTGYSSGSAVLDRLTVITKAAAS